ncbi:MAG: O-antigen ligase family protein [Rubripirellula sp.]|nr:O-antigen ligase family protein [Rubripirellula sp.]
MLSETEKSPRFVINLSLLIAFALSAVAVWTAWDDGGGHRWTQAVGTAIVLGLIPLGVLSAWRQRFYRTPTVVFLAMAVWLVAAVQCLPLPPTLVKTLSPGSYDAYREWIPTGILTEALESPDSPAATVASSAIPISVSPTFTRMALALPLLFAVGCWLSSLCFSDRRAAILLLLIPAVVGGLFAFFGLADMIRLARDSDYDLRQRLLITPVGADGPFGPFINNNTCAGYLNLTIGCAVGLLLGMRHRTKEDSRASIIHHWPSIVCILLIVVMVAGILGSNSRGGFVGLATASVVLALFGTRGWSRLGLVLGLLLIAVCSVLFLDRLGIREQTSERLETLVDGTAAKNPRLRIWQDGLDAAWAHLPMGAGLGAYRYANLPYQQRTGDHWAVNADGMHVEWLLEGGVWLIPILLLGITIIIRDTGRLHRRIRELPLEQARLARAVTIALTFSVASLFATQSFDFGITHIPLLVTLAILVGGLFRLLQATKASQADQVSQGSRAAHRVSLVLLLIAVGGLGLATWDLHAGGVWQKVMIDRYGDRGMAIQERKGLDQKIERLQRLVEAHPRDAMAHRTLAQLLLDQQQQLGAFELLDQGVADGDSVTKWVSPQNVRRAFYENYLDFESLLLEGQEAEMWRQARQHAVMALMLSPLDDTARVLLVETDCVDEGRDAVSGDLLVQAARLRPKTKRILNYVETLAEVHPGGRTLEQVQAIKTGASARP